MPEQALLRIVTEHADVGLVIVGPDRRYVYGNSTYSRILGLPNDLVGKRVEDMLPDVYESQVRHRLDRAFAGERVRYDLQKHTGDIGRHYAVRYEPVDADGVKAVVVVITDITDRIEGHLAARRAAAIVESSDDAIIAKDLDGIVTSWNQGAERIFGYTAEEMLGVSIKRLIPEECHAEEDEILATVRSGKRVQHLETVRRTKSGELISISVTSSPIKDDAGNVVGASKVARDITARKQSEVALQRERDRAQRYLDTAEVILLALDVDGRITAINRKGCDLLGWAEAELIGRDWVDTCVPPRIREDLHRKFGSLVHGDFAPVENPVLTRTGDERMIEWRNNLLRDDSGQVIGTFSSGTDITERHQAVEALRTAEERMRFALEGAGVGIWDMEFATGVARMSEIMEQHFGLEPGSFAGTFDAFIHAVHPGDREELIATINEAIKSGGEFRIQHRALRPDGTVRWLSSAGRIAVDSQGKAVRGIAISSDITDRRSLEAQYHQAQKMEAIGRLAGGVAHDFNNLLTAILGYCQLLLEDLGPGDPRRADVLEIHRAGESAAGLTRQLLAFSRKQIIEPAILDLNVIVGGVRSMLQRLIGEDVKFALNLRPGVAPIRADAGQMEQIVLNLAVNARDAMPAGGTLTIETANVELDENYATRHFAVKPGAYVCLTVSDTGTGMSQEVQQRLFEPFFTTKEAGKGTGLGLATVHGIVTRIGGSIGVYSEVGRGTSFAIYLPQASPSDVAAKQAPAPARTTTAGETILVVDDAPGLREMTRRMLERQGYTVLLAASADEAMHVFESSAVIDVLLTDVIMPGGSGPELVARLAATHPGLKVVYMSGYTDDAISHHGMLDPGIALLHKPFTAESLGAKLREALRA